MEGSPTLASPTLWNTTGGDFMARTEPKLCALHVTVMSCVAGGGAFAGGPVLLAQGPLPVTVSPGATGGGFAGGPT